MKVIIVSLGVTTVKFFFVFFLFGGGGGGGGGDLSDMNMINNNKIWFYDTEN